MIQVNGLVVRIYRLRQSWRSYNYSNG